MSRSEPELTPRAVPQQTPMIMQVGKSHLLWIINQQLKKKGKLELPLDTEITFSVPGGGDYSNEDVSMDNERAILNFRWKA